MRFFLLWVLGTNLAFFPGLVLGWRLTEDWAEPWASTLVALCFALPVGLVQWGVLRTHVADCARWIPATALGWGLGAFAGAALLALPRVQVAPESATWVVVLGLAGGAAVGVGQLPVLRRAAPGLAAWWIGISALGWAVLFPGVVTGAFLAAALPRRRSLRAPGG